MVQRPVAGADGETIRGYDRRADILLGLPGGGFQRQSLGEAGGNCRRQRTTCAMSVFGRHARRRKPKATPGFDEQIDALGAAAMAAFDENRLGTLRQQLLPLRPHLVFVFGKHDIEQAPRPPADWASGAARATVTTASGYHPRAASGHPSLRP